MNKLTILVGCEESQAVTVELRKAGHEAYSCDIKKCSGNHPEWHLCMDVFKAIDAGNLKAQNGTEINIKSWDMGIFFPDCTFLTCSAEWAYKDGPYHQNVKPETLVGADRKDARLKAIDFVKKIYNSKIPKIAIENPVGKLSTEWMKPSQSIHPHQFGNDASKRTCLWLKGLPLLIHTEKVEPRYVNGRPRWGNQTDSGQNKLPPSDDRAELRSKTYSGIAKAMANQWTNTLE